METVAREHGFRDVFHGDPGIGGRYSVLSHFGLVPAAALGLDVAAFLAGTQPMACSCAPGTPPAANPGVRLGALLGVAARGGRDKLTVVASPADPRPRRLAGAAAGRDHGQAGQRHRARR